MAMINNDSIGGYGMGGFGGGWGGGWGGIAPVGLFGIAGRGLGGFDGDRDRKDCCCDGGKFNMLQTSMDTRFNGIGDQISHEGELDAIRDTKDEVCDAEKSMLHGFMDLQKCCCDVERDVLTNRFENAVQGQTLLREIDMTACKTEREILNSKYDTALQLANLQHNQDLCCCKTNENITIMGFQTQLRDMENQNCTNKQLAEIKCLITDTAKDTRIQGLECKLAEMSQCAQTMAIKDCIKDAFCKTSSALNQIGVNQEITAPDTSHWPPFVPSACC